RGLVCGHGTFWPGPHSPLVVLRRLSGAGVELLRPRGAIARAARPIGQPVLRHRATTAPVSNGGPCDDGNHHCVTGAHLRCFLSLVVLLPPFPFSTPGVVREAHFSPPRSTAFFWGPWFPLLSPFRGSPPWGAGSGFPAMAPWPIPRFFSFGSLGPRGGWPLG